MFTLQAFFLFLAAALLVAVTPGPGIFYIVARTLAGGRTEGLASSVGLGLGGLVHVLGGARRAFREGIVVEALNPKTAAFFLAFIPQFVDPSRDVAAQFVVLGLISVTLNTSVDLIVTHWAAKARAGLAKRPSFITRTRQASGAVMCGLGATLLVARRAS
jgi:threonine/homoserine/homoserine lactone efflux protein